MKNHVLRSRDDADTITNWQLLSFINTRITRLVPRVPTLAISTLERPHEEECTREAFPPRPQLKSEDTPVTARHGYYKRCHRKRSSECLRPPSPRGTAYGYFTRWARRPRSRGTPRPLANRWRGPTANAHSHSAQDSDRRKTGRELGAHSHSRDSTAVERKALVLVGILIRHLVCTTSTFRLYSF